MEGGVTDARPVQLHGRGVASVVFGLPARHIHSHAGVIHMDDYDATLRLMVEIVKALDSQAATKLLEMD
jgi:endoglucanase